MVSHQSAMTWGHQSLDPKAIAAGDSLYAWKSNVDAGFLLHIWFYESGSKPLGSAPAGVEGQPNKVNNRKNLRTGSAALSRRPIVATNSSPPSPAALRASMSLQLQLLLRFLPTLCTDSNWKIVAKVV
ncbi:mediator of RNA polymerase II transcription subunit 12-like isoform X2 [Vigna angularis]|uniref:mediator of RNA polymerase II transcription subunit 12-like isoform X2 n=1 Tax=Phaseolus angularis TaxID=3914 RepID=UPI0022B5B95B|nr:mediator of RNA polymerase II transcription subunit 12-like isoform X2 [Vigna angularis]